MVAQCRAGGVMSRPDIFSATILLELEAEIFV